MPATEFVEIRRRIHAHPEIAFEETRTGGEHRTLGLRADMDALADPRGHRSALRSPPRRPDARL